MNKQDSVAWPSKASGVAKDQLSVMSGIYNLMPKKTPSIQAGQRSLYLLSLLPATSTNADLLQITGYHINICGKPAASVCQVLKVDSANPFVATAQLNLPENAKFLKIASASFFVKNGPTVATGSDSAMSLVNNRGPKVAQLGASQIYLLSVPNGYSGSFRAEAGAPFFALGQPILQGNYIVPVIAWEGAKDAPEPTHGSISGQVTVCTTR